MAWDEIHRGRLVEALDWAQELIALGRRYQRPAGRLALGLKCKHGSRLLGDDYTSR